MFAKYLSCPVLLTEASLIDDSHIPGFLKFLEDRGYAPGTIHQYLGAVVHFESWQRVRPKPKEPSPHGDVKVFIDQHLIHCQCPRSFPRYQSNARAALKHWLRILYPTFTGANNQSASTQLINLYDHYLAEVAGLSLSRVFIVAATLWSSLPGLTGDPSS